MSLTDSSTHSLQIVSGSNTTVFTYPNTFTLQLPSSGFTTGYDEIALKSLTLYYSWPNVSSQLGNDRFAYIFNGVSHDVVLGDGIYSFADIQNFLQQLFVANGHYLLDANSNTITYMTLVVNPALYCLSLTCAAVPSQLPLNWTNPANMDLAGNNGYGLTLVIPSGISRLTGFAAASYPAVPQQTLYQMNSGIPQITDVTSLNVTSDVVDSSTFSLSPNVLASFVVPSGQTPGTQIQYQPLNLDWTLMQRKRNFQTMRLSIVSQSMQPVILRDISSFVAILSIRKRQ